MSNATPLAVVAVLFAIMTMVCGSVPAIIAAAIVAAFGLAMFSLSMIGSEPVMRAASRVPARHRASHGV